MRQGIGTLAGILAAVSAAGGCADSGQENETKLSENAQILRSSGFAITGTHQGSTNGLRTDSAIGSLSTSGAPLGYGLAAWDLTKGRMVLGGANEYLIRFVMDDPRDFIEGSGTESSTPTAGRTCAVETAAGIQATKDYAETIDGIVQTAVGTQLDDSQPGVRTASSTTNAQLRSFEKAKCFLLTDASQLQGGVHRLGSKEAINGLSRVPGETRCFFDVACQIGNGSALTIDGSVPRASSATFPNATAMRGDAAWRAARAKRRFKTATHKEAGFIQVPFRATCDPFCSVLDESVWSKMFEGLDEVEPLTSAGIHQQSPGRSWWRVKDDRGFAGIVLPIPEGAKSIRIEESFVVPST